MTNRYTEKISQDKLHLIENCSPATIYSPSYADAQTPVQTLLTSPSPQGRSLSPELPLGPNAAYLREVSLPTRLKHRVKSMQPSEVEELYGDKDAVISMLMESHKANIGDYSHVTKEEMLAQQKAHYVSFVKCVFPRYCLEK